MMERGLPRSGLTNNGSAMLAAEITEGLARLGLLHETTLAFSPYQNAKCEVLWGDRGSATDGHARVSPNLTLEVLERGDPSVDRVRI